MVKILNKNCFNWVLELILFHQLINGRSKNCGQVVLAFVSVNVWRSFSSCISVYILLSFTPNNFQYILMFKLYFLTSVADVVASVSLNYQLIQNFLEFETLIFLFRN
jgi:hypothetical protein